MAGIYVHIPFCHAKCGYCDFYSVASRNRVDDVVDAILREYEMRKSELSGCTIKTLYLGGGTPSILPTDAIARIAEPMLTPEIEEFTIEVNPEDVTEKIVDAWTKIGVNRISMGVQSFIPDELRFMRRRHSVEQVEIAIDLLRRYGISNLSLDLIFGVPGQTMESWAQSLDHLFGFSPEHFSAYILSYPEKTLFHRMLHDGSISEVDSELIEEMYSLLTQRAKESGYDHYEISSYSKPGFKSKHNSSYWDSTPYLGLGPAAHSFTKGLRRENPSSIVRFCEKISSGNIAYIVEEESEIQRLNDVIITRLRTSSGLPLSIIPPQYAMQIKKTAERQKTLGNIGESIDEQGLPIYVIPESRFIVSDPIMEDFIL